MLKWFQRFEEDVRKALAGFSHQQRLLLALIVCRRFRSHYDSFSRDVSFGDPEALAMADTAILSAFRGTECDPERHAQLRLRLDAAVPSQELLEEVADTPSAFLAQDAAVAHINALGVLTGGASYVVDGIEEFHGEIQHAWWLANSCYEAADRESGDHILPDGGIFTPEIEAAIFASAPIQRELSWHGELLSEIGRLSAEEFPEALVLKFAAEPLRDRWRTEPA